MHIALGTSTTLTHCTCSLTGMGLTFKTHAGGTWEWGHNLGAGPGLEDKPTHLQPGKAALGFALS